MDGIIILAVITIKGKVYYIFNISVILNVSHPHSASVSSSTDCQCCVAEKKNDGLGKQHTRQISKGSQREKKKKMVFHVK